VGLDKDSMLWEASGFKKFPLIWNKNAHVQRPAKLKELTSVEQWEVSELEKIKNLKVRDIIQKEKSPEGLAQLMGGCLTYCKLKMFLIVCHLGYFSF
jgi:hypothetical protein